MAGTLLLLFVTRRGAYVSPDSLAYVGTARNLLDGHGLSAPPGSPPLGNFAQLYSLVLSAGGLLGPDPLTVARWASPLAFGGTILVVGLLARRLSGSVPIAIGAQVLVLAGSDFLRYGSAALSESLFLLLAFSTVLALWSYLDRPRPGLLAAAGVLAGATCLTRYVGLAVVAAGVAVCVLLGRRWKDAAVFAAIALAPLVAWFVWLQQTQGRASNRTPVLHLPGLSYAGEGLRSAAFWLLPLVAVAVAVASTRRLPRLDAGALLVALFGGFYLGALLADRLLFDVTGRLDGRFLLVVHVVAILLVAWLLRDVDVAHTRLLAQVGLVVIIALALVRGGVWLAHNASNRGFADRQWAESAVVDEIRTLPAGTPVYTNQPDLVWFATGRDATLVPEQRALLTGRANSDYDTEVAAMAAALDQGGLLVYFTDVPARRVFLPTAAELAREAGLTEVARDDVGVAYR